MINHFNIKPQSDRSIADGSVNTYKPNSYREEINSIIKPIDEEDANSEIEKGEIVYNPNTMLLHKATGQKHAKGGTPVNLEANTFIFSDFKKLGIKKNELEQFEFKTGGTYKPQSNTPAKIVEREIDLKHHNHMVNITQNQKKNDKIAMNTAQLMLKKNMDKLGQIAYVQEQKKNFPDGQPAISKGTAPIYSNEIDNQLKMSQQYPTQLSGKTFYKAGGMHLPQYQVGKSSKYDPTFYNYDDLSTHTPKGIYTKEHTAGTFQRAVQNANQVLGLNLGMDVNNPKDRLAYQTAISSNFPGAVEYAYNPANNIIAANNRNPTNAVQTFQDGHYEKDRFQLDNATYTSQKQVDDALLSGRLIRTTDKNGYFTGDKKEQSTIYIPNIAPQPALGTTVTAAPIAAPVMPAIIGTPPTGNPAGVLGDTSRSVDEKLPFSTLQKLNLLDSAKDYFGVKTYYPLMQNQQSVLAKAQLIDDQPLKNNINQSYFNAAKQNQGVTNPAMFLAANKELAGQRLDKLNEVTGNVIGQNNQIINGEKQAFAQTQNNDAGQNRLFDKTYYDATKTSLQNRDDMRDFKKNEFKTLFNDMSAKKSEAQTQLNMLPKVQTTNKIGTNSDGTAIYSKEAIYKAVVGFDGISYTLNPNISPDAIKNIQSSGDAKTDSFLANLIEKEIARNQQLNTPASAANITRLLETYRRISSKTGK